ncbi:MULTISPECIES: helix-hairpin-helix domain-containing protein [unclassified Lentimonas]|uniref:helix-hairpin-helix domain-containing protein n=1 Tax=unclassified Lentimonas TaxID=2630993 RepID=UPI001326650D|nr:MULTISPECIES: helix-hairpin-helix domain-containing protein [unclassified Lentimonas]CAA6679775.1 Unannotated [Lentimonas sp. CC4]CAA6685714.1 Unannotated [Lentimonas sp. CC6]CAA7077157.1 Unannotated [Lentimonas sp. CC4]CAA7168759.1 Unannotated [Lentimonas sp. CC21]CAA7180873.1 Unannotated [Lentimonas sp. CC8]
MIVPLTDITGIGPSIAIALSKNGFKTINDLAKADVDALCAIPGFGPVKAKNTIAAAANLATVDSPPAEPTPEPVKKSKPKPKLTKEVKAASKSKKKSKKATKSDKKSKKTKSKKAEKKNKKKDSSKKTKSKSKPKKADKKKKKKK